jgi:hypothetical protein
LVSTASRSSCSDSRGKTHAEWVRMVNECALALDEGVGRVLETLKA